MDRLDVDRLEDRAATAAPGPAGAAAQPAGASSHPTGASAHPSIGDPDQTFWRDFARADTPEAFYRSWLALQCRQIAGAVCGVVVLGPPDSGSYAPAAFWPEGRRNVRHLAEVAERALTERRGLVIPREARRQGEPAHRARYDVAYPIQVDGKLHGVVALEVAPRQERDLQSVLRQIQWGAAWLEGTFLRADLGAAVAVRDRLRTVLDLVATAFGEPRFTAAATAFATAVATRLGCDRASLGFVKRGRVRVRAMSHTAQFGERTNLVRAIAGAMDEAIDQQAIVIHPAPGDRPPQVSRMHADLAHQQGSGSICTIPLSGAGRTFGALTLERPADRPFDTPSVELAEALAAMAGPVLDLHRRDDRWLAAKAVDSLRTLVETVIGPRYFAMKLGAAAVAAVIAFLAVAQDDFRAAGTTTLEPVVRQAAVAPFNGYIVEAPLRAGDLVRRGQLLARLDDRDLKLERLKRLAQHEQFARQHQQALAKRDAAQVVILSAQMDQVKAEIALFDEQLTRSRVQAPSDGIVVTGDLSQMLSAPVERGQVLFEIAPLDAYRLIIQVDERDVAEVKPGQHGTLVLTGAPADSIPFTVEKVTPVSTSKESRNYFRVEAKLDGGRPRLRPGMEGVAKIEIDRRLLAWIWTRQVIDWVRLQVWTWTP